MYGDAIRTGFAEANGTYSVVMDCDGSHEPKELIPMLARADSGADLVIGSRYVKGGHTDNNAILRFMSFCVNLAYRFIFGLKVHDVSDSFRVYRTEQVKPLNLECDNFDLVEEILIRLSLSVPSIQISEHPISFRKRQFGESKRDLVKFILSYIKTIEHLYYIKLQYKGMSAKGVNTVRNIFQFIKFGIVGVSNAAVQLAITYLLMHLGLHYEIAYAVAFIAAVSNAFFWNSKIVFHKKTEAKAYLKTFAVYTTTLLLGMGLMYALVECWSIRETYAPIINIAIMTPMNYLLNKRWTYK